ncbi:MAG: nucleotidyltransferase domain-containing protein [Bacteroidota bacterium]|nr:nucleotidyltransferase domain-containing protein [Bacteroidota bacterium]MDX5428611.1 nucleotidyltransferase domain-containing protein [Bacteroidota bacterium]MDX5448733.1 nucleotidyltransferase domain-containing protein [Bacteroidota bacterium]MDX5506356.1 nucleotidyltransferase domain-containing protein [Bacteroidota bacterium]
MTLKECLGYEEMILEKLIYFSIFRHPLKVEEIHNLLRGKITLNQIQWTLNEGVAKGWLYENKGFFTVDQEVANWVMERRQKEEVGIRYFKALPFWARLIRCFPFVRGVAVSGSLSKGVIHDNGDIDYFIITTQGRLWLTRTFLVLFKKAFLLNSRRYFCVNYFISEDHLDIPDHNVFTATEIEYLIPIYNEDLFRRFREVNQWVRDYFGEFNHPVRWRSIPRKGRKAKEMLERVFGGSFGDRLDDLFMRLTLMRWRRKFSHFDHESFDLALRSKKEVSKHHPQNFQEKVLSKMNEIREKVEQKRMRVAV